MFVTGGLAEEVDEKVLHAAFIPFGDLIDIQIPLDYETGESGGGEWGVGGSLLLLPKIISHLLRFQKNTEDLHLLNLSWQRWGLNVFTI